MTTKWIADIVVMPKAGVNDPEGEAILGGLHDLGYATVTRVRSGKRFQVELSADDADRAAEIAISLTDRLLANPVIETFTIERVLADSHPSETGP